MSIPCRECLEFGEAPAANVSLMFYLIRVVTAIKPTPGPRRSGSGYIIEWLSFSCLLQQNERMWSRLCFVLSCLAIFQSTWKPRPGCVNPCSRRQKSWISSTPASFHRRPYLDRRTVNCRFCRRSFMNVHAARL